MKTEQIIDKVITLVLDHEVNPGDHAGGSGHLSFVSYSIKDVSKKQIEDNILEIICLYHKNVLTEFIYEPDNPPYQSSHEKKVLLTFCDDLNNQKAIKKTDEETFKDQINKFIEHYLLKIEQEYGECRAPIKFPPYYYSGHEMDSERIFFCFIDTDLGENGTFAFAAVEPEHLLFSIKKVLKQRFGFDFFK